MSVLQTSVKGIFYDIKKIELPIDDFERVERVLKHSGLSIEEFCAYAISAVAETHCNTDGSVTDL
jgi:hypothetical protein